MGVDAHGYNFLRFARLGGDFGRTIMIGRQSLQVLVAKPDLHNDHKAEANYGPFTEKLLAEEFGATDVDAMDYSAYEGANVIQDMNKAVPPNLGGVYQTVLDFGSLEHVFDVGQALRNVIALCSSKSGQILHVLPANNFCGHGFWQFSPELFFSLYSAENGFENTEIFVASLTDETNWYRAHRPQRGKRLNIISKNKLYLLVKTTKIFDCTTLKVQQSDYVAAWTDHNAVETGASRSVFANIKRAIWQFHKKHILRNVMPQHRFSKNHPDLEIVDVRKLLKLSVGR